MTHLRPFLLSSEPYHQASEREEFKVFPSQSKFALKNVLEKTSQSSVWEGPLGCKYNEDSLPGVQS